MIATRPYPTATAQFFAFYMVLAVITGVCLAGTAEAGKFLNKLPTLEQALAMAARHDSGEKSPPAEVALEVRRHYDLILARREQLEISREVQGHFEKALTQAEKKFEEGEGDVSLAALTKLELGLVGALNDISQFNSDIALAQLYLAKHLGIQWAGKVDISGPKFRPVEFSFKTLGEYIKSRSSAAQSKKPGDRFALQEAFIKVNKAREKSHLAAKTRKMTRALLVTEVANYDFGIGDEADLFEALIIYTRVLVGYFDAIYEFNISVYYLNRVGGQS